MNQIENQKGYTTIIFVLLMPIILMFSGIILDGSMIMYNQNKLMVAVKYATLSATTEYDIQSGKVRIDVDSARNKAEQVLMQNSKDAEIAEFLVENGNECHLVANLEMEYTFMKLFGFNKKILHAEYYAVRNKT
ncbi:TadE/TadG family type IV pilus assembly protein [Fusibacter sp. JL216-2]|uniref:TadE/TadG family type IV pilus assembly protein n=1 Tax=Fusibacter sp. JL216-2 TaxID=3071453 RepID=UPI003D357FF7